MSKVNIKNIPKKIYLQVGEIDKGETIDFNDIYNDFEGGNITWCVDKIYDSDIEYRLKEKNPATCNKIAKGIITLCGSTRFYKTFLEINNKLTEKGYIVLSIGIVKNKKDVELLKMLDVLHREKILMSDSIFVIDQNGYIGKSTKGEIEFAEKIGKRIYMLSKGDIDKL